MKIRAIWRKKDFNPFYTTLTPPLNSFYYKEVEVPEDCDMAELRKFAEEDSREGYVFARFEVIEPPAPKPNEEKEG